MDKYYVILKYRVKKGRVFDVIHTKRELSYVKLRYDTNIVLEITAHEYFRMIYAFYDGKEQDFEL